MRDRQKLETLLARRFPGSTGEQIAAAANAIMALVDEWGTVNRPAARVGNRPGGPINGERHERSRGH